VGGDGGGESEQGEGGEGEDVRLIAGLGLTNFMSLKLFDGRDCKRLMDGMAITLVQLAQHGVIQIYSTEVKSANA